MYNLLSCFVLCAASLSNQFLLLTYLFYWLRHSYFARFLVDMLFYIFYSMPRDEAQLYAAHELYNRGWFYHKEYRVWFIRVPNMELLVKTNTYERGSYFCFDPNAWDTIRKDNFVVHYDTVEKKPALP